MRGIFNKLYSAYDVLCIHAGMFVSTIRTRVSCALQGCAVGRNFRSTGAIRIKARAAGGIVIGNYFRIFDHDFHALDAEVRRGLGRVQVAR